MGQMLKLYISVVFILASFCNAQDDFRKSLLEGSDRPGMLARWMEAVRNKPDSELIVNATNRSAAKETRIASAVVLLKERKSKQGHSAALSAFSLRVEPGLDEWESACDWRLKYPVAAAASQLTELMPAIVKSALDGDHPEDVIVFVLLESKRTGADPTPTIAALKSTLTSDEQRKWYKLLMSLMD